MANFAFYNGQAGVVNLDNVDIITRSHNSKGKYEIEFYRSNRKSRSELPEYVAVWTFQTELERDQVFNDLIYKNGAEYTRRVHL